MRESRDTACRQARSPRFAAERPRFRFIRSNDGAALTEYAFLLGAVVCIAVACVYFCGDLGIPFYERLAGALAADEGSITSAEVAIGHDRSTADPDHSASPRYEARSHRTVGWPAILSLAAAILALSLWHLARRRRQSRDKTEEQSIDKQMENRLHIKRQILWKNILNDPRLLLKNRVEVRHLMTRDVSVVARRTPTDEVRRLMDEKRIHHVLVCDGNGQLQGVVSDRDLPKEVVRTAGEVMTENPMTVRPETTAGVAIATMLEQQISCLPVVQDEELRGILTRTDLLLSLQCMLQWWLRFAQGLTRAAECTDKIEAVQSASGRYLGEQRARLFSLTDFVAARKWSDDREWIAFESDAQAFLDTAGELIAMQTFEGDRLAEMAGELLEIANA